MTKKRLENIWYYYKIHIIIVAILLIALYNIITTYNNRKEQILQIGTVNITLDNKAKATDYSDNFKKSLHINSPKKEIFIYDSINLSTRSGGKITMNSNEQMRLVSYSHTNSLDVVLMDIDAYKYMCKNGYLCNLEKLIKTNDPKIYKSLKNKLVSTKEVTNTTSKYSNYKCAIELSNIKVTHKNNTKNSKVYVGVISDSNKKEMSVKYIEYLNNLQL
ncbi:hypothetical protein [Lachnobacterium bovis]|uniref:hypothetical protein n=1 Tax=Lachnobacterium bovis TaxID=140626 RepID=UPI0003B55EF3|nr:hypothetical protein [Lachnobacterium bovis]